MAASTEPRSGLSYAWALGESGWNTGMDANLLSIGRFAYHLSVKDRDLTAPPGSPAAGDTYIVGASATGDWAGEDDNIAVYTGAAWAFGEPRTGWVAYVEDEYLLVGYTTAWGPYPAVPGSGGTVTQVTSKTTGVTLNKPRGSIVTHNASLASYGAATFSVTNSFVGADDVIILSVKSATTAPAYICYVSTVAAGSFNITIYNQTAGALAEAITINFSVIKGRTD